MAIGIDPERDEALVRRFAEELAALAARGPVVLELPPLTAWNVLGLLQLALRHPLVAGSRPGRDAEVVIAALRSAVAESGARAEVAARGDRPGAAPTRGPGLAC